MDLPLVGYFPEAAQPDAGVLPDIAVATMAADIARGADSEMARVRAEAAR